MRRRDEQGLILTVWIMLMYRGQAQVLYISFQRHKNEDNDCEEEETRWSDEDDNPGVQFNRHCFLSRKLSQVMFEILRHILVPYY